MKGAYPVIISKAEDGYYVEIPDFSISTQGDTVPDAMEMARDAIGLMGIDYQDEGKELPQAHSRSFEANADDIVTLVDVDFSEYRKKMDNRAVKKNCTIPYWLNVEAEKAGVNYSKILQEALMKVLGIHRQSV